ncbi:MAG: hypothetical protein WBA45_02515 [Microthrixaceae bacterium]
MPQQIRSIDPLTPVLVGVGTSQHDLSEPVPSDAASAAVDRAAADRADADRPSPLDLMELALRNALQDTGVATTRQWLREISLVAVTEGNWAYGDPGGELARRVGIAGAKSVRVDIGVPQHTPIAAALKGIRGGTIRAAVVVGGEAKETQLAMQRAGLAPVGTAEADPELAAAVPDERWQPGGEIMAQAEIDIGMWSAVEHYACIEAALRHAEGQSIDGQLDAVADLWHRFNLVATDNPDAAFGEPKSAEFLRQAGPGNRPLAFPYAKWHSTQWAVDQAAALLLCSVELAEQLGVPRDRWLFPRVALESSFSLSLTKRANMHRWEAMGVLGDAATEHLGGPLSDIEHTELYSCFPSAVRVQQRELGLNHGSVPTIMGGMAFAGGPFNNFTYQATVAMADRLRSDPGALGLVTTVSGLLTKPALAVWSTSPGPLLVGDLGERADHATPKLPVVDAPAELTAEETRSATIASLTVTYAPGPSTNPDPSASPDSSGHPESSASTDNSWLGGSPYVASSAFVIADLSDGRRWIGTSNDADLLSEAQRVELIGQKINITGTTCRL